jgi:Na+-transporting NADH:ubiquinone oxidoreductase subunit C
VPTRENTTAPRHSDGVPKALLVTFLVALSGSLLVSGSAVMLQPRIEANRAAEREQHLMAIVGRLPGIEELFERIEDAAVDAVVVDITRGEIDHTLRPEQVDAPAAVRDAAATIAVPRNRDIAGLGQVNRYQVVYLVRAENELRLIVLPLRGQGYSSTLQGFLGLAGDANTIVGLSFYEHGETPGLGGRIDDPQWRAQWQGKQVRDPEGRLRIEVVRDAAESEELLARYQVDALTGATFTSRGVHNIVRFWLGDDGFGPFLRRLERR